MTYSTKYSYLVLRLGLAAVFFWFGIDKFFHPSYWINAWTPAWFDSVQLMYLLGIFEVLIGLSLLTKVFSKAFSLLGILFLLSIFAVIGITEVTIRDIGLMGGLLAVFLWPEHGDNR